MKTKEEMIYDFMVALAANPEKTNDSIYETAHFIYCAAEALADRYLATKAFANKLESLDASE